MRKIFLVNWIFLLIPIIGISQNANNHWQLGVSDVNFTTNLPVVNAVANGGKYGEANLSDANGNLLLYTNGINIWNNNHLPVTNGTNTGYAIDNVLIVPNPANSNQYYVFRAETYNTLGSSSNSFYNYSIVEFNTTYPQGVLLNINATPDMYENNYKIRLKEASGAEIFNEFSFDPLTVAKNSNSDGYWLILQSKNKILSYKIDASGLNIVPVESVFTNAQVYDYGYNAASIGFDIYGKTNAKFKVSPDNTKIGGITYCAASRPPGIDFKSDFYTLNFNSATGQFSNYVSVHSVGIYSIINNFEFSNDSGKVYFTKFGQSAVSLPKGEIVVKDLTNLSSPERVLNDFNNSGSLPANFNFLQRDKYGNLLVSSTFTAANRNLFIHKVENQNSYSTSSVSINSISLNGNSISQLPQLIPLITNSCPPSLLVTANVTSGSDFKQALVSITATNSISSSSSAVYHAGNFVLLSNGFNVNGAAKFRGYIEGCTGTYLGRINNDSLAENGFIQEEKDDLIAKKDFIIYPNPSNSMIIVSSEDFKMKQITISSLNDNRVILNQKIDNLESVEVDVTRFEKGIYIVSIESTTGEILTQKLIKN